MENPSYTTVEVAELTGIKEKTLLEFAEEESIFPLILEGPTPSPEGWRWPKPLVKCILRNRVFNTSKTTAEHSTYIPRQFQPNLTDFTECRGEKMVPKRKRDGSEAKGQRPEYGIPLLQRDTLTTPGGLERLLARDVWCAKVQDFEDLMDDPQVAHNELIQTIHHPEAGEIRVIGVPVKFSETPGSIRLAPPRVGEHTDAILTDLGYTPERIAALRAEGVI